MVGPVLQAVCPYRLRGMGTAMATMYIFFIGGFARRDPRGLLHQRVRRPRHRHHPRRPDEHHRRPAADERRAVHPQRPLARRRGAARGAGGAPQAHRAGRARRRCSRSRNIDFSYGPVQVLFDVNFEVHRGEMRRAARHERRRASRRSCASISGLEVPERGVVRLNGRNITYVAPEPRARHRHRAAPRRQGRVPEPHRRCRTSRSARGSTAASQREIDERDRRRARAVPRARASGASSRRAASRAASSRCSRSRAC